MGNTCTCSDKAEKEGEVKVEKSASMNNMKDRTSVASNYRDSNLAKDQNFNSSLPDQFLLFETDDPYLVDLQKNAPNQGLSFTDELVFENGAVYKGYLLNEMRHGPGVQVWPDQAKYEGEWRNNKANGKGKFWHADGDIYHGEWKDDKANGYGVYMHVNGAKYEGYWKDDLQDG